MAVNKGFSKGYAFTMAAGTGTAVVSVPEGFERMYLQIPTATSASAIDVYTSTDGGTTYYQLRHMAIASASSQTPTFIIANNAMSNGAMVPIPPGFKDYKIKCTDSSPVGAVVFTMLGNT